MTRSAISWSAGIVMLCCHRQARFAPRACPSHVCSVRIEPYQGITPDPSAVHHPGERRLSRRKRRDRLPLTEFPGGFGAALYSDRPSDCALLPVSGGVPCHSEAIHTRTTEMRAIFELSRCGSGSSTADTVRYH